jgi:hypothetical protein
MRRFFVSREAVAEVAHANGVLHGKVLAIDATTLEANAAMKSSGCGSEMAKEVTKCALVRFGRNLAEERYVPICIKKSFEWVLART